MEEIANKANEWLNLAGQPYLSFDGMVERVFESNPEGQLKVYAYVAAVAKAIHICDSREGHDGLSPFEAQLLMWSILEVIFNARSNSGFRLNDFDWLLDPSKETRFTHIPSNIWAAVKAQAVQKLKACEEGTDVELASVREHLRKIAAGVVPFGLTLEEVEVTDELPEELNSEHRSLAVPAKTEALESES